MALYLRQVGEIRIWNLPLFGASQPPRLGNYRWSCLLQSWWCQVLPRLQRYLELPQAGCLVEHNPKEASLSLVTLKEEENEETATAAGFCFLITVGKVESAVSGKHVVVSTRLLEASVSLGKTFAEKSSFTKEASICSSTSNNCDDTVDSGNVFGICFTEMSMRPSELTHNLGLYFSFI